MKFFQQILSLFFFALLLSTFIDAKTCITGELCYPNGQQSFSKGWTPTETKECSDNVCYGFKCINHMSLVMYGYGCYEDFLNACKYIQSKIKEDAKGKKDFSYNDENVIAVSCSDGSADCAVIRHNTLIRSDPSISEHYGSNHTHRELGGCDYDNSPISALPQVQCRKGGQCITSGTKYLDYPDSYNFTTCSECVQFICGYNDRVMRGYGCLEDFEQICTNIPSNVMQKIKANPKNYFYADKNVIMVTCSYKDDCQMDAVKKYVGSLSGDYFESMNINFNKSSIKTCSYEPLPQPKIAPSKTTDNGSNNIQLSGMIIFGFIFFYLLW
uniref:Uncharacterized protein n=1 Tax=Panagrolaimus davidi TaxID=227884 RepID=A0A914PDQ2_9BILA